MANTPPAHQPTSSSQPMSKDEQLGYHKGAVSTLIAERNELYRLVQITESLLQAHLQELDKLGVKLQTKNDATK